MNQLIYQLQSVLPDGMSIPKEIEMLYEYIEENGYYIDRKNIRYGFLCPEDNPSGTNITFRIDDDDTLKYFIPSYFGDGSADATEVKKRVCIFARSGKDGSLCALWLNEQNETKIVHLGTGSGSMLYGVIAENAVDFLRLIAIGYDEICWESELKAPPRNTAPNIQFQNWVRTNFNVEIPQTGAEIVTYPLEEPNADDPFCVNDPFLNWLDKVVEICE